jgi:hypothetical protein
MVADAASRYDYKRLTDLGMQVSRLPRPVTLRQKLHSLFIIPSLQAPDEAMVKSSPNTSPSVVAITTSRILPPLDQSRTGWLTSSPRSNLQPQSRISALSNRPTSEQVNPLRPSKTNVSKSSLRMKAGLQRRFKGHSIPNYIRHPRPYGLRDCRR